MCNQGGKFVISTYTEKCVNTACETVGPTCPQDWEVSNFTTHSIEYEYMVVHAKLFNAYELASSSSSLQ